LRRARARGREREGERERESRFVGWAESLRSSVIGPKNLATETDFRRIP